MNNYTRWNNSIKEFKIDNLNNMQNRISSVVGSKLSDTLIYHRPHKVIELLKGELQRAEFEINALIKSEQEERITVNTSNHGEDIGTIELQAHWGCCM